MTNDACTFMFGFLEGRYPGKDYTWEVIKSTTRNYKDPNSKNKYTLIIMDNKNIVHKSAELEHYSKASIDDSDIKEMTQSLK